MQWSEITKTPPPKQLRQFAGLFLVVFLGLAGWRVWSGRADIWAAILAAMALAVGGCGLVRPSLVRWIFTGWMMAAFPIGWTISWLALALLFYGIFTPVALLFRLIGRDALRLRRWAGQSYWTTKDPPPGVASYFRQS